MGVSLNYCSQNGGNVYRAPYYNGNPNIGPLILGNLDQYPYRDHVADYYRGAIKADTRVQAMAHMSTPTKNSDKACALCPQISQQARTLGTPSKYAGGPRMSGLPVLMLA